MGMWRLPEIGGQLDIKRSSQPPLCVNDCGFYRSSFFVFSILYSQENDKCEENFHSGWLRRFWFVMVCVGGSLGGRWLFGVVCGGLCGWWFGLVSATQCCVFGPKIE